MTDNIFVRGTGQVLYGIMYLLIIVIITGRIYVKINGTYHCMILC